MKKSFQIITLITFLMMAGGVKMHGQEATETNQISVEQKVYELSVLWKEMSFMFGRCMRATLRQTLGFKALSSRLSVDLC